jgi:hypothetical protein
MAAGDHGTGRDTAGSLVVVSTAIFFLFLTLFKNYF